MNVNTKKVKKASNQNDLKDKTKTKRMILDKMDILTKVKTTKQRQRNGVKLNFLGGIDMPT